MKPWFDELLQNAAFPAVVLAFACAPLNNHAPPPDKLKSPPVVQVPLGNLLQTKPLRPQPTSWLQSSLKSLQFHPEGFRGCS
jgi:hypothetical protein